MHDAGGLMSSESEAQRVWRLGGRNGQGDLVSRGFGVQGVGMVITSSRDAAHMARRLVID